MLETSESTVRRDLDELEAENKLRRVHGGAELPHSLQEEETIQEKICQKPSGEEVAGSESSLSHQGTRCHLYRCWNNNCFF